MYKAYEAVPPALKEKLKGRRRSTSTNISAPSRRAMRGDISGIPHGSHPVFITHPDTGRKSLFVDRLMTARIEGMSARGKRRDPQRALRHRRAARVHLRACLAARRFPDVGQSLHDPRAHRFSERGAPAAAPLHRRGRAALRIARPPWRSPADARVFDKFIGDLRALWSAEATCAPHGAGEAAARAAGDGPELKAHSARWPSTEGRKNLLLYVDPDHGFVVNARGARAGPDRQRARSRPCLGALWPARRQESLERYDRIDDGSRPGYAEVKLVSVTTGSQGKVDLVPPHAIHAEQGGPTRSVAIILRSQRLGEGTVLQHSYDRKANTVVEQYGPTQIPHELVLP